MPDIDRCASERQLITANQIPVVERRWRQECQSSTATSASIDNREPDAGYWPLRERAINGRESDAGRWPRQWLRESEDYS